MSALPRPNGYIAQQLEIQSLERRFRTLVAIIAAHSGLAAHGRVTRWDPRLDLLKRQALQTHAELRERGK